jgi:hypothetical protein
MMPNGVKLGEVMIESPTAPRSRKLSGDTVPCRIGGPPAVNGRGYVVMLSYVKCLPW